MRWALRGAALILAIINAGFIALAIDFDRAREWGAVLLANFVAVLDRVWFRMIECAPAALSADEQNV